MCRWTGKRGGHFYLINNHKIRGLLPGGSNLCSNSCHPFLVYAYYSASHFTMFSSVAQSCLTLCPWTVACQVPLSMGFSRQEYWSGLPFPSPGDLPNPGIELGSSASQADALGIIWKSY